MIARFSGAMLGLLAFTITAGAGLYVRNPVAVTLSRSILALFIFCAIGLVLGGAAQMVVAEHEKKREEEFRKQHREEPSDTEQEETDENATGDEASSTGT